MQGYQTPLQGYQTALQGYQTPLPPEQLMKNLQRMIFEKQAAGLGVPELGIPPTSGATAPTSLSAAGADMEREISLRRLLADMLKIDQFGMTDAAFRETVRLELETCLEAKERLKQMELRGTAAPISPTRRSSAASTPAPASTQLVNSSNAAAAGSYVAVANVNKSFDMLVERAWGYRKRLSEVKEEVLEHWEVTCMHVCTHFHCTASTKPELHVLCLSFHHFSRRLLASCVTS